MKQIIAGVFLLLVLGLMGFLYRYEVEKQPMGSVFGQGTSTPPTPACTTEAKVCPDGSAVGRTGPNCSLAACPPPNAQVTVGSTTLAYVVPSGYKDNKNALGQDETLVAAYEKPSATANAPHAIVVRAYAVPTGQTPEQVMVANTMFESSGIMATSTSQFKKSTIGGKTFYMVTLERFEGQVHTAYYLLHGAQVFRFEALERDVKNWTDPNLNVATLPEQQALQRMLGTLQVN